MSKKTKRLLRIDDIIEHVSEYNPEANLELIQRAYVFSSNVHLGQIRLTGEPYLQHPLSVAMILAEMKLDENTICAGLLHDTVEDTYSTVDELEKEFGKEISFLVDRFTIVTKILHTSHVGNQAEAFRKMILVLSKDVRVILIKLADCFHNMKSLKLLSPRRQISISKYTLDTYVPIANLFGLLSIKRELEDLSLRYLEPKAFKEIEEKLVVTSDTREKYIHEVIEVINEKLNKFDITATIIGRPKHIYSIFNKMKKENLDFSQIYDLTGFRIIVEERKDCYEVLGILHSIWKPVPGRFKDYISLPKRDMYQSLHTVVIGPYGQRIEIQIRTYKMDKFIEKGLFEPSDIDKLSEILSENTPKREVLVFTPNTKIITLPIDSCPIDFAYSLHSEIGNHCSQAEINGLKVPLQTKLKNGDVVSIIKSKEQSPKKSWLDLVKTAKARTSITQWIKSQDQTEMRSLIKIQAYQKARELFETIIKVDNRETRELKNEIGFLFRSNNSAESDLNYINNNSDNVIWKQHLWEILSENNASDLLSVSHNYQSYKKASKDKSKKIAELDEENSNKNISPQKKGEKLEEATINLFQKFFSLGDDTLNSLRRQGGGIQYGHDISFDFKFNSSVIGNPDIHCHVECKNYKDQIKPEQVTAKLASEEMARSGISHWILISPYAKPSNELNQLLEFWKHNSKYSFDVQIWSPDNNIEEFFGIAPLVYDVIYKTSNAELNPHSWTDDKRQEIFNKWRDKLKPPLRLPNECIDYLQKPEHLLLHNEERSSYDFLYSNYVPMNCKDFDGNLIGLPTENYVMNWLHNEQQPVLFLLGEFGDGKSLFTYILARKLAEQYLQNPNFGWFPIRFALKDFYKHNSSREFVENRVIRTIGSLKSWEILKKDYHVLAILDGFDEVSIKMDRQTIVENIKCLVECCEELEPMKILITSRTHFFKNTRDIERLKQRTHNPDLICLSPISRKTVRKHLETTAVTPMQKETLSIILQLHDPIGLASKPLFLQMIKETFQGSLLQQTELSSDLNELILYDAYINESLERKKKFLEDDNSEVLPKDLTVNLIKLLEDIAWEYHLSGEKYVLLSKFRNDYGSLAEKLWQMSEENEDIPTLTSTHEEDATARLGVRSLLTTLKTEDHDDKWPVDFCHRSIREYFVAKKISRLLTENPSEAKLKLASMLLGHEILDFVTMLLCQNETKQLEKILLSFIKSKEAKTHKSYLGSNAVTLLYRIKKGLPGTKWSSLFLDMANLDGADLSGKDFSGTSLQNANLDNVNFEKSNFSNCNLKGVKFKETGIIQALACHPSGNIIIAAYDDGSIWEWDVLHPRQNRPQIILTDAWNVSWIGFSPSEDICAIVGNEMVFYERNSSGELSQTANFIVNSEYSNVTINQRGVSLLVEDDNSQLNACLIDPVEQKIIYSNPIPPATLFEYLKQNILIHTHKNGVTIFEINNQDSKKLHDIEIYNLCSMTIHSIVEKEQYYIACGQKNGDLSMWKLALNSYTWEYKQIINEKIHNGSINCLTFLDENRIVTSGTDKKIFIISLGNNHKNGINKRPLFLNIKCKGMKIKGVKGPKEYSRLKELIANSKD